MSASSTPNPGLPPTAMAAAFDAAGFKHPSVRLGELALAAVRAAPSNLEQARTLFSKSVRGDADLLWELFIDHLDEAMRPWLANAAKELRAERMPTREQGQGSGAVHLNSDQPVLAAFDRPASPTSAAPAAPQPWRSTPRLNAWNSDELRRMEEERARSKLYTFIINGRPIGEVTAGEADAWARSRDRDAYFVRLLIEGMPPDLVIGKARTPEEADRLYARAEAYLNA